jgi:tetratricopeptide (TPR) repeat protein
MTTAPSGKIDNALLGNWAYGNTPVKISRQDDFHYTVNYDGANFSAYLSDIGTTHFLTLFDGKTYNFLQYNLTEGGKKLSMKFVNDELISRKADSATIRKVIASSLNSPKLYALDTLVLIKANDSKKSASQVDVLNNGSAANYKNAEAAYNKGNYAEVVRLMTLSINDYFNLDVSGDDYVLRAKAYLKMQKYKEALADINNSIKDKEILLGKDLVAVRYALQGDIYFKLLEPKKAIESYTNSLKLNPKIADVYKSRGDSYLADENYWSARDDFNQAIKLNPQLTDAYLKRGYVFEYDGDDEDLSPGSVSSNYKAALADFDKVLQLDPKNENAMNSRGYVFFKQNKKDAAIAEFKKVLAINPNNGLAIFNLKAISIGIDLQTVLEYERVIPYFVWSVSLN